MENLPINIRDLLKNIKKRKKYLDSLKQLQNRKKLRDPPYKIQKNTLSTMSSITRA